MMVAHTCDKQPSYTILVPLDTCGGTRQEAVTNSTSLPWQLKLRIIQDEGQKCFDFVLDQAFFIALESSCADSEECHIGRMDFQLADLHTPVVNALGSKKCVTSPFLQEMADLAKTGEDTEGGILDDMRNLSESRPRREPARGSAAASSSEAPKAAQTIYI